MNSTVLRRVAAATIVAVAITLTGTVAAQADVTNGTFDSSVDPWWSYGASLANVDGQLCATSSAANRWDAGVGQDGIPMTAGDKTIAFTVTGEGTFKVNVETPENTNVLARSSPSRAPRPSPTTSRPRKPPTPRSSSRWAATRAGTPSASTTSR